MQTPSVDYKLYKECRGCVYTASFTDINTGSFLKLTNQNCLNTDPKYRYLQYYSSILKLTAKVGRIIHCDFIFNLTIDEVMERTELLLTEASMNHNAGKMKT